MAATRASIMSDRAAMSGPAPPRDAAVLARTRSARVILVLVVVAVAGDYSAVAVRHVLAPADVGNLNQRIELTIFLQLAQGRLDDAVVGPCSGGLLVLLCG